ncbi:hypothetical protein KAI87_12915, partial [Myxococcota bacterium]|nr:hypothetical protein [Myxococcota bacterium]
MTTAGGGWQLISSVRTDSNQMIVGTGYCTSPDLDTNCKGQLHPLQATTASEILIHDQWSGHWLVYDGFDADATSGLAYFTRELILDSTDDCGATTDNSCMDTSFDPSLRLAAHSDYRYEYHAPLYQWWRWGGWWVGANPLAGDWGGLIHASSYSWTTRINSRSDANSDGLFLSAGHQLILHRENSCSDGIKNGNELNTDCGGICDACTAGGSCLSGDDCGSGICSDSVCHSPLASCLEILTAIPNSPDGVYAIDLDGSGSSAPFGVYCDMNTAGGGWTRVLNLDTSDGHVMWW